MKFMKLGSKPDLFQSNGDHIRYVATELATDIVVIVGEVKFYLHKFPLLSRSARLQKLVAVTIGDGSDDEIEIDDIPGGPGAFEICAKFCYGMTVTLNAYNVLATRCAAEYLEMYESIEKGNLIYKIEVFLTSSIFRAWKDSIIVLQTTRALRPWSDELKVVGHCLDSIASKASIDDTSNVHWSYTYNRNKHVYENRSSPCYNGVRKQHIVPKDWWVEDLCELPIDLYKRVLVAIKAKGAISAELVGESLKAYVERKLGGDDTKNRLLVETVLSLLPPEKNSMPCGFLLKLLRACIELKCGERERRELTKRIGQKLDEATVADLLIRKVTDETMTYDIETVHILVEEFVRLGETLDHADLFDQDARGDVKNNVGFVSDESKASVAKLIDGYLAEIAGDPNLSLSEFVDLADMVSPFPRAFHDRLYRAIDLYLKEHPGISKSERRRICKLMDCRKLSAEASMHAVQNERLPLRVLVQVLFFEQVRAATGSSGNCTPDLATGSARANLGSHNSSSWGSTTTEGLESLKAKLDSLRLGNAAQSGDGGKRAGEKNARVTVMSRRMLSRLWFSRERLGENSSSDTSESACSTNADEIKSTPSGSIRRSLS